MGIAKAKGERGKCDTLFSLIVRAVGECEHCHIKCECPNFPKSHTRDCKLTCSHIIGRRYSATRTYRPNAQSLCYSCHRRFTDWPVEFHHWIVDSIGSEAYEALQHRAEAVTKVDWAAEHEHLKEECRWLGIL